MFEHHEKLDMVNLGTLVGDHDPLSQKIRVEYIGMMDFKETSVDDALRTMLKFFNLPG